MNKYEIDIVERAEAYATVKHEGQVRRFDEGPYIQHPARVAKRAKELGLSTEAVAAAWLHDVVEDCGVDIREIVDLFGILVADMVWFLSDLQKPDIHGNRAQRVFINSFRFYMTRDEEIHTLKLLDSLDNAGSIRKNDPEFWKVYREEIRRSLRYVNLANPAVVRDLLQELDSEEVARE